jgi:hypothetical protein
MFKLLIARNNDFEEGSQKSSPLCPKYNYKMPTKLFNQKFY